VAAGNLILIVLGVLALYGLWTVFRQKGAAAALGLVALGAFVGYLVESADGDRLQRFLAPNGAATPQVAQPSPFVAQPAYNPESGNASPEQPRPTRGAERSTPQDAEPRTPESTAPPAVARREVEPPVSAPPPAVTRREPDPAPPSAVTRHEVQPTGEVEAGGVRIVVEGSWGLASGVAVESAIREALRRADWDGLHSGGRKVLRVRGSLEDRGLTLGQVPTAAATLNWSLESASGAVLHEGGFADLQGTGTDDAAARAAALRRAAGRVASELSH
jgi:hypothetical protein